VGDTGDVHLGDAGDGEAGDAGNAGGVEDAGRVHVGYAGDVVNAGMWEIQEIYI
jgi:hypothetical protein